MKSLTAQGNDESTLKATYKVEGFTVPVGRLSEVHITLKFANDHYKNRFLQEIEPRQRIDFKSIPGDFEVDGILPQADYKPTLELFVTFDDGDDIAKKPAFANYGCPGKVNIAIFLCNQVKFIALKIFASQVLHAERWNCSDGSKIALIQLCDGKGDCSNDESPEECQPPNQDQTQSIGLSLVFGFFSIGCFAFFFCKSMY